MDEFVTNRLPLFNQENTPVAFGGNFSGCTFFVNPGYLDSRFYNQYVLYFAHHSGNFIRVATSKNIYGDWTFPNLEILKIENFNEIHDHIASPEVFLDQESKTLNLFFHSRVPGSREQQTFLATSKDGVSFDLKPMISFLPFYLRVCVHNGGVFGVTKGGNFFSHIGSDFSNGWRYLDNIDSPGLEFEKFNYFNENGNMRHLHIVSHKETLLVFYTRIGDAPERIYAKSLKVHPDNSHLEISEEIEVMRPQIAFECQTASITKSQPGLSETFELAFRDPFVFTENELNLLFYSYGGESGIAVCQIDLESLMSEIRKKSQIE
jgi:hypothetical protein